MCRTASGAHDVAVRTLLLVRRIDAAQSAPVAVARGGTAEVTHHA